MMGSFLLGRQMQMLESIYGYLLFSHFPRLKRLSHNTRFVDSSRYYHRRLKDSYPIVESRKPFCTTSPRFRGNRNDTRRYILSPLPLHAIHILIIDPSPIHSFLQRKQSTKPKPQLKPSTKATSPNSNLHPSSPPFEAIPVFDSFPNKNYSRPRLPSWPSWPGCLLQTVSSPSSRPIHPLRLDANYLIRNKFD